VPQPNHAQPPLPGRSSVTGGCQAAPTKPGSSGGGGPLGTTIHRAGCHPETPSPRSTADAETATENTSGYWCAAYHLPSS
jgi:hypothetical protein